MFLLWSAYSYLLHLCAFLWYTQLSTYEYTLSDVPLSDVLYCLRPVLAGPLINAPDVAKFDPWAGHVKRLFLESYWTVAPACGQTL